MRTANPGFDYEASPVSYSGYRATDPCIAAQVHHALGEARHILNVGAGTGSYEPEDKYVVAVEPSASMRAARIAMGRAPAINAFATNLPFDDGAFDASMAMVTIHHWPDIACGLKELRRVTRRPIVLLTFDPEALASFWLADYFPELVTVEQSRFPSMSELESMLGGSCVVEPVSIPLDCTDGFTEAFYGRPEAFLDEGIRRAQSCWSFLPAGREKELIEKFAADLAGGLWDAQFGHLRAQKQATYSLRLVTAWP